MASRTVHDIIIGYKRAELSLLANFLLADDTIRDDAELFPDRLLPSCFRKIAIASHDTVTLE